MNRNLIAATIAALLPAIALANGDKPQQPTPAPISADSTSQAGAIAAAGALAGAIATGGTATGGASTSDATATGGNAVSKGGAATSDAIATGGTGGSATQAQDQTASAASTATNAGNSQALNVTYRRQAPSTSQGSIVIGTCGAGGNAGGSNSHGSAFLGIAWTPNDCKLLLAASAYQSLGMYDSACEMVNGIRSVRKRWKELGVSAPSCEVSPPAPVEVVAPSVTVNAIVSPDVVTHAELAESQRRQDEVFMGGGVK